MPSPHRYVTRGRELGIEESLLARAAEYRRATSRRGVFPLLTLRHLAHQTQIEYGYLRRVVERQFNPYVPLDRRKNDGRPRAILSPHPLLMGVQRWLLKHVLSGLELHESAFAYRTGRSVRDCAEIHVGARWIVKMDLHDFFGSIGERQVYREFLGLGYPPLLAFEMGRICTTPTSFDAEAEWLEGRGVERYGSPQLGSLPQGAPTSGALANAVARELDDRLALLAQDHRMQYTRYSDDIVFSSSAPFDRERAAALVRRVEEAARRSKFEVHRRKTRIVSPGARKVVLGLVVHDEGVRLRPEFRRRLQDHVRCVALYGPAAHARTRGFRSALSMINYVEGAIAYARDIEPAWGRELFCSWSQALTLHGHPMSVRNIKTAPRAEQGYC